jgi:hypothetical protein
MWPGYRDELIAQSYVLYHRNTGYLKIRVPVLRSTRTFGVVVWIANRAISRHPNKKGPFARGLFRLVSGQSTCQIDGSN